MSGLRVLRTAEREVRPWKNGGGTTAEVAVFPPHAGFDDFEWRVSLATVARPGGFSRFEGVDRTLVVVEGTLELALEDQAEPMRLVAGGQPCSFPGDVDAFGTPIGGKVVDLNLMTRRNRWRGALQCVAAPARSAIPRPAALVLFTAAGRLCSSAGTRDLAPMDAVCLDPRLADTATVESEGTVLVVQLLRLP